MDSLRRLGLDFLGISDIEEEDNDATTSISRGHLIAFPSLIKLELEWMSELEEWVLPFERNDTLRIMAQSLEELTICRLHSLKRIGPELFGISEDDDVMKGTSGSSRIGESVPIIVFPKLKKLEFNFMFEWEEWEIMMPSWRQDVSFVMPCLKELILDNCKKLKEVPRNIFSYQPVKEEIVDCMQLNQRSGMNQIIRRREVGERGYVLL
ncbi:hypothetical protein GIB67_023567 [Kingdonia uniflora]|uniref:Uncharacterized protein n=1 Tax=Kingdonia uniflora TaxID=39325 RepID=A0A7J7PA40_9MAGN|nr:hypothetical protein GIB67_023567 [Kingdonia uniflora]